MNEDCRKWAKDLAYYLIGIYGKLEKELEWDELEFQKYRGLIKEENKTTSRFKLDQHKEIRESVRQCNIIRRVELAVSGNNNGWKFVLEDLRGLINLM